MSAFSFDDDRRGRLGVHVREQQPVGRRVDPVGGADDDADDADEDGAERGQLAGAQRGGEALEVRQKMFGIHVRSGIRMTS